MPRNPLINKINRTLDIPMAFLSLVMLGIILVDLTMVATSPVRMMLDRITWVIWAAFVLEFIFKLSVAEDRRLYVQTHWLDAVVVFVPMLRVARVITVFHLARALPFLRFVAYIGRSMRGLRAFFREHYVGYLFALTLVITLVGSAFVFLFEHDVPGTRFRTYGDALWFGAALMTTVASDLNPQTAGGRIVAVGMMLYSMTVFVYLVGSVAGTLMRRPEHRPPSHEKAEPQLAVSFVLEEPVKLPRD